MKQLKDLQAGDIAFVVNEYRGRLKKTEIKECEVIKVGQKYIYTNGYDKFSKASGVICDGVTYDTFLFATREAAEKYLFRSWAACRLKRVQWEFLSYEDLTAILNILGISATGIKEGE